MGTSLRYPFFQCHLDYLSNSDWNYLSCSLANRIYDHRFFWLVLRLYIDTKGSADVHFLKSFLLEFPLMNLHTFYHESPSEEQNSNIEENYVLCSPNKWSLHSKRLKKNLVSNLHNMIPLLSCHLAYKCIICIISITNLTAIVMPLNGPLNVLWAHCAVHENGYIYSMHWIRHLIICVYYHFY